MLRRPLLLLSRSDNVKRLVSSMPVSSGIVARFVAGDTVEEAVETTGQLEADGLLVTLDFLGEDTLDRAQADATVAAYRDLLSQLADAGMTKGAEVSVKLSAVGQALPGDGERIALDNARVIAQAAANAGTTVTLDMEDHTTTDSTLGILRDLRQDYPTDRRSGAGLSADALRLTAATWPTRARGCGSARAPTRSPSPWPSRSKREVNLSYVRCLRALMEGDGYPMIASHDPRLIEIAGALATRNQRPQSSYEYQMLFGIRPDEQKRLAAAGEQVRVYVPYGDQWYGYLMRRLAERPANLTFFARSLMTKS